MADAATLPRKRTDGGGARFLQPSRSQQKLNRQRYSLFRLSRKLPLSCPGFADFAATLWTAPRRSGMTHPFRSLDQVIRRHEGSFLGNISEVAQESPISPRLS
jgi:hypothetical protein